MAGIGGFRQVSEGLGISNGLSGPRKVFVDLGRSRRVSLVLAVSWQVFLGQWVSASQRVSVGLGECRRVSASQRITAGLGGS